jgi:DNA polymerase-3 subunit epsilon
VGLFSRRRHRPEQEILIQECPFVVLDTELTGLDTRRDSIVSIGAVRMQGLRIDLSNTFTRLVRPETVLSHESILIHGITPSEVAGQPGIGSVLSDFSAFCSGDILVGFCIAIDMAFLNKRMKASPGGPLKNPVADIYRMYEWLRKRFDRQGEGQRKFPVLTGAGLYEMARLFDIPFSTGHDALTDAFLTAQIFQRVLYLLTDEGILIVKDLLDIADPYKAEDVFSSVEKRTNFPL